MVSHRLLIVGLVSCVSVTACGLKGPLYLPDEEVPEASGDPMSNDSEIPSEDIYQAPK